MTFVDPIYDLRDLLPDDSGRCGFTGFYKAGMRFDKYPNNMKVCSTHNRNLPLDENTKNIFWRRDSLQRARKNQKFHMSDKQRLEYIANLNFYLNFL